MRFFSTKHFLERLNQIFHYTRCITPKRITSWRDPSPRHCARATQLLRKKCCSSGQPLATLSPIWLAEIWTSDLTLQRRIRPPLPLDQLDGCFLSRTIRFIFLTMNLFLSVAASRPSIATLYSLAFNNRPHISFFASATVFLLMALEIVFSSEDGLAHFTIKAFNSVNRQFVPLQSLYARKRFSTNFAQFHFAEHWNNNLCNQTVTSLLVRKEFINQILRG